MDKLISKTQSFCNQCYKPIPAEIICRDNRILIRKKCSEHGQTEEYHVWDDPEIYEGLSKLNTIKSSSAQVTVALTYKCNLNCPVCYAKANENSTSDFEIKDFEKIKDYEKVYLTGGEPTIRKDLPKIISLLRSRNKSINLLTNGVKLADKKYLNSLKKAGLSSVTLQFDSVDGKDWEYIRGENLDKVKKAAIKNLDDCGIPVLLYSVILKNNLDKIKELIEFGFSFDCVRAVGLNPLWKIGRYSEKDYVPSSEIIEKVCETIKIKKSDWVESTALLCNLDKLLSFFYKRKRYYSKCMMKCLLLVEKGRYIPATKVFNVKKINRKIENLYESQSQLKLVGFFLYFLLSQIIGNYISNRNFRIFIKQIVKNIFDPSKRRFALIVPFNQISLAIFPTIKNLDFNFIKDCNFKAVSADDFSMRPACIHRIFALKSKDKSDKF